MPTHTMKTTIRSLTIVFTAVLSLAAVAAASAGITVGNVRAAQRVGTKLVDISYDVAADTPTVTVWFEVSVDGGATFNVPVTAASGDIGAGVEVGTGKAITWNAGADWDAQYSAQTRYRVVAYADAAAGFALIPSGSFVLGDQSDPLVGNSDELPAHTVYVSAFHMDKYEVTKELWDEVRAWGLANGYTDLPAGNGGYASKGPNHPVHSINWYDVVKWCNARSQKEELVPCYTVSGAVYKTGPDNSAVVCDWNASGYRLPTEAEWEKAARGGLAGKNFPWGDIINHSYANYFNDYYSYEMPQGAAYHPTYAVTGTPFTSPVGSFPPNGYGLYDMAGNVWEWCHDWYSSSYYSSSPGTDPRGPASGSSRVIRGGGWGYYAFSCRAASRVNNFPDLSVSYRGFRPARSSVP